MRDSQSQTGSLGRIGLHDIVETSRRVREASGRLEKVRHLAACLERTEPDAIATAVAVLSGELRQGRIGIGPATVHAAVPQAAAAAPVLTLSEVDAALDRIARTGGVGSATDRARLMNELLARATREEQDFLVRVVLGELRQGALEGLMVDAVAQAAKLSRKEVQRALMISGNLGEVARAALSRGRSGLAEVGIQLFRPLKPMLAHTAKDTAEALRAFGRVAFEYKLDGARIQVHKQGRDVRVFTRHLNDVTDAVPEIVDSARDFAARTVVLDGEALAFRRDGMPQPFQVTMRRFGRKLEVEQQRDTIPLQPFFFDCLFLEGAVLLDRPCEERFAELAKALPEAVVIRRRVTGEPSEAEEFLEEALARGHEGVMAKDPSAPYEAGARGRAWLKIKPVVTLDLVVLAAEWGHGRRDGWLSNLHLGARDPATGGFVMLGKTFKGMTDEMLAWQTAELQRLAASRDAYTVYVRPELVVEIAFNDVQASPRYPGGLALRFARVKRYRPDKRPEDADTIETVRLIYERHRSEETEGPATTSNV